MRGATGLTLQRHQIVHLPRKMTLMIDPHDTWNVIYNVRSNRHHPPTSPNTAPATQNCIPKSKRNCPKTVEVSFTMADDFAVDPTMIRTRSEMIRACPFAKLTFPPSATHFVLKITTFRAPAIYPDFTEYFACHKKWPSKITKYCACHEKWLSWWMPVTYETSFTMRGAIGITLQRHQMVDARHIWNVIYNARSNRHHPPTSPNTAPATQNCIPKSKRNCPKTDEVSFTMRDRSDHDPRMIRPWTRHLAPARSPRLLFTLRRLIYFVLTITTFRAPATQIWPNTAPATKSDTPRSPNIAPATKSDTPRSPNTAPATKVALQDHQIAAPATKSNAPRSPNVAPARKSDTEVLLDWTVTWLQLVLYWTIFH